MFSNSNYNSFLKNLEFASNLEINYRSKHKKYFSRKFHKIFFSKKSFSFQVSIFINLVRNLSTSHGINQFIIIGISTDLPSKYSFIPVALNNINLLLYALRVIISDEIALLLIKQVGSLCSIIPEHIGTGNILVFEITIIEVICFKGSRGNCPK